MELSVLVDVSWTLRSSLATGGKFISRNRLAMFFFTDKMMKAEADIF